MPNGGHDRRSAVILENCMLWNIKSVCLLGSVDILGTVPTFCLERGRAVYMIGGRV